MLFELWVLLKGAASLPVKEVLEDFKTTNEGLINKEAAKRLAEHGPNMLVEKKTSAHHIQVSRIHRYIG